MNSSHWNRRSFLRACGVAGLASICAGPGLSVASAAAFKVPQSNAKAKAVIQIFLGGGPSQLDMFDNKPELAKRDGQEVPKSVKLPPMSTPLPKEQRLLGPRFPFRKHGDSGAEISDALPELAKVADDLCILRACSTDDLPVRDAQRLFHTGFPEAGKPSIGSWLSYELSPTFVPPPFVVFSNRPEDRELRESWTCGPLRPSLAGCLFREQGDALWGLTNPSGLTPAIQRQTLDIAGSLGTPKSLEYTANLEDAFRLQATMQEASSLTKESNSVLATYGCLREKPSFSRNCLLARRLIERGVKFISLQHHGWDAHANVAQNVQSNCAAIDRGLSALISDLKIRGLLDSTLIICGGEFGRSPIRQPATAPAQDFGRYDQLQAFSMWMAGGGIRHGMTFGETDELGFSCVENPVHIVDLQATIFHLMGVDPQQLRFNAGVEEITFGDFAGSPVQEILQQNAKPAVVAGGARPYFGVIPELKPKEGIHGLAITGVSAGSPAEKAGLKKGDAIFKFGKYMIHDIADLDSALKIHKAGDTPELLVIRGDDIVKVKVTLTSPQGAAVPPAPK